ncbi:MAG: hypothetical protein HXS44_11250 [Theionarchaea archaeon]|nr:hypothetical protein [Theionarchaea archaeon]
MDQSRYLKPMELGEILDASVRLYRKNFLVLITVQLPLTVILFFILATGGRISLLGISVPTKPLTSLIYYIQLFIVRPLTLGAITKAASDSILKGSSSVKEAYRFSLRNKRKLIVTYFIISVVSEFVVAFFIVISLEAIIDALTSEYIIYSAIALICASIILALGVSVASFLWIRLMSAFPIMVNEENEKIGSLDAMKRSWNLLTGYTAKMFFAMFIVILIPNIIQSTIPALEFLVERSSIFLTIFFGLAAQGIIYPLVDCTRVVIYFELKVRKEGFDLEERVRQVIK